MTATPKNGANGGYVSAGARAEAESHRGGFSRQWLRGCDTTKIQIKNI